MKALFSFLAAEEEKHLGLYRQLRDVVGQSTVQRVKLIGEYGKFIDILCSEITDNLLELDDMSDSDYIEMALLLEKNTLLAFNEIKTLFNGKEADIISKICDEEKSHIIKILEYSSQIR